MNNTTAQSVDLTTIKTATGNLVKLLQTSQFPASFSVKEIYTTECIQGINKNWRLHKLQTCALVVLRGSIEVAASEDLVSIETFRIDEYARRLTIPPGVWFNFRPIDCERAQVLNVADREHDPAEQVVLSYEEFPCWRVIK